MVWRFKTLPLPGVRGVEPVVMLERACARTTGEIAMLHSAAGMSASVIGIDPLVTLEVDAAGAARVTGAGGVDPGGQTDPLGMLGDLLAAVEFEGPHPLVGWLGFIGYEIGRTVERIRRRGSAGDSLGWPLLRWSLFRHYLLFEPGRGEWRAAAEEGDWGWLEAFRKMTSGNEDETVRSASVGDPELGLTSARDSENAARFCAHVQRVKEYIADGDIYQANIARHWRIPVAAMPVGIYGRLCALSAAPYAGFLRFASANGKERFVLSASPELFLNVQEKRVVTRPIKGTRRRDRTDAARDAALRDELVASEKDQAELAMIVDLMRNDLGRVAKFGTVKVEAARELEEHPTVWHTAATISAELRDDAGAAELLRAVCPGGSITGAPKIRAMEIIEEFEGFERGLYCGNIGVIGPGGRTMTLNIAIRTILLQDGMAHVYAGGGIVADSVPEHELQETADKAAAMLRALGGQA